MIFVAQTPNNKTDSIFAHQLLREKYTLMTQMDTFPSISRSKEGKPYFTQPRDHCPYGHFNLSHSQGFVAVAFGATALGVDIQVHRPVSSGLVKRVCTLSEQQWLQDHPEDFSLLWAEKEAYIKCKGETLGSGRILSTLSLPLPKEGQVLPYPPYSIQLWREPCYSVALCYEGLPTRKIDLEK